MVAKWMDGGLSSSSAKTASLSVKCSSILVANSPMAAVTWGS